MSSATSSAATPAAPAQAATTTLPVVAAAPATAAAPTLIALPSAIDDAVAYADRVRGLTPPELVAEIQRLQSTPASPQRRMELAIALLQTQAPADRDAALEQLTSLLADDAPAARGLHPLARMLSVQQAQLRRLEERMDRQAQLLRDTQRRVDQLNERLEALRMIERSMPTRPAR